MTEASIFPSQDEAAGWAIVIGLATFSLLAFLQHGCVVKKWRTYTFMDAFFDRRRVAMTESYFKGSGTNFERAGILMQFLVGSMFGLWAIGALIVKLSSQNSWLPDWPGVMLWFFGIFPFLLAWKRAKLGHPERVKPKWLIEEERRRGGEALSPERNSD